MRRLIWFADLRRQDVDVVGGKNSSLDELIGHLAPEGVRVPDGFAAVKQHVAAAEDGAG